MNSEEGTQVSCGRCRTRKRPVIEGGRAMWFEDHFGSGSQRNERVKLAASFWNNVGAGMVIGGFGGGILLGQAVRHLDQNRHCDSWTCAWVALLLDRQQHADLYAHSTRRTAVKGRPLNRALHGMQKNSLVESGSSGNARCLSGAFRWGATTVHDRVGEAGFAFLDRRRQE